jgi:putative hydrolase of the HAD superfamily
MFRAVLFDLGGVLLSSPFDGFAAYERARGLPAGAIRSVNATRPDANAWACFERGEIGRDEFIARFEAEALALGHDIEGDAVLDALRGTPVPPMIDVLQRVHRTHATALLTNNLRPIDADSLAAQLVLPHCDVVVQSSVEGVRKPDSAFYALACERLGVGPAECVFLDDLGVNLKPARDLGMHTIKVVRTEDAIAELDAALAR